MRRHIHERGKREVNGIVKEGICSRGQAHVYSWLLRKETAGAQIELARPTNVLGNRFLERRG